MSPTGTSPSAFSRWFLPAGALAAAVLIGNSPRLRIWLAIDTCLDRGGSFNYVAAACDFQRNHPYRPEAITAPWVSPAGTAMASGILLPGLGLLLFGTGRRASGNGCKCE